MPDITMCKGENCGKSKHCYRHMAIPCEYRQSFFLISPINDNGSCTYYSPIRPNDLIRKEDGETK